METRIYFCTYIFTDILTDFNNSFTLTLSSKFAIKRSLKITPHLMHVATLSCEILMLDKTTACPARWDLSCSRDMAEWQAVTVGTKAWQKRFIWSCFSEYQAYLFYFWDADKHHQSLSLVWRKRFASTAFLFVITDAYSQSVFLWIFQCG